MSNPSRCPVCGGNGLVPEGFYNQVGGVWNSSGTTTETCRSCDGVGIVWPAFVPREAPPDHVADVNKKVAPDARWDANTMERDAEMRAANERPTTDLSADSQEEIEGKTRAEWAAALCKSAVDFKSFGYPTYSTACRIGADAIEGKGVFAQDGQSILENPLVKNMVTDNARLRAEVNAFQSARADLEGDFHDTLFKIKEVVDEREDHEIWENSFDFIRSLYDESIRKNIILRAENERYREGHEILKDHFETF